MSAKSFIAELDRRKLLSDRLMTKLQASVAEIRKPLSADDLANFLVQKKLLTRDQANDVLGGLTLSGVNLDQADLDSPISSDTNEGSSVLSSHIGGTPTPNPPQRSDVEVDEEIGLAPIEEPEEQEELEEVRLVPLKEEVPPNPAKAARGAGFGRRFLARRFRRGT